jgi:hypothetical protein
MRHFPLLIFQISDFEFSANLDFLFSIAIMIAIKNLINRSLIFHFQSGFERNRLSNQAPASNNLREIIIQRRPIASH